MLAIIRTATPLITAGLSAIAHTQGFPLIAFVAAFAGGAIWGCLLIHTASRA